MCATAAQMQRVNVIGTSGSGKTTFSRRLAERLDVPHVEMDALFWKPDWQQSADADFERALRDATAGAGWVLDGNYSRTTPIKWARADTVIWLDFGFVRTLRQILARSIGRAASRHEIWVGTGNRESFRRTFASRESIVLWMLGSYRRNRRRYSVAMSDPKFSHIRFVRLRSPRSCARFLAELDTTPDR